jgi:tetratricopeptide (TPR) repeat protein
MMKTVARFPFFLGLVFVVLTFGLADAQHERLIRPPANPGAQVVDLRRRLVELDRLLTLKSVGRAESLLEELEQHSVLTRELVSRRIRLAQLRGDHEKAVEICRTALAEQPLNAGFWRSLTTSLLAVDQPDSARLAAGNFISTSPNKRSAGMVAVNLFQDAQRPRMVAGLIDSLRWVFAEGTFLGRQKAVALLALEQQSDAADEVVADLRSNPFNLSLVRSEILEGGYRPGEMSDFVSRLEKRSKEPANTSAEVLLTANLYLMEGNSERAVERVMPLLATRTTMMAALQNSVTLTRELPLLAVSPDNSRELQATVDYLLEILGWLSNENNSVPSIMKRAADNLAQVCETALENHALGDDPQKAAERFAELLSQVRRVNPVSEHLYSSQIKLATFTRDELQQPMVAARRLERLLMDLDLPLPGVALVRLTLGECYLAAGDTTRGRIVLTRLGRDPNFRQAGGHAHYQLARLDLAQGNLVTARDRFAVVAMDNPAAPYSNDALELGLAITEEMENPSGGPEMLLLYSQSVYYDLVAKPELRLAALESFVAEGVRRLDLEEPQHLLERARFQLAESYADQGRLDDALLALKTVVLDHPRGRFPAEALMMQSRLQREAGQIDEARQSLEQLLAQYPDFLFIDDARDAVRSLP